MIRIRLDDNQVEKIILSHLKNHQQKADLIHKMTQAECRVVNGEIELVVDPGKSDKWLKMLSRADIQNEPAPTQNVSSDSQETPTSVTLDHQDRKNTADFHPLTDQSPEPVPEHKEFVFADQDTGHPVQLNSKPKNPFLIKGKDGTTFFHECAKSGHLREIPDEFWTTDVWFEPALYGETFVHWAGKYGTIDQIPEEYHDADLMLIDDDSGETFLHKAAFHGFLYQCPKEFLVDAYLLVENINQQNCLHKAAESAHFNQIPANILSHEILSIKDAHNFSVMDYLVQSNSTSHLPKSLIPRS